MGVSQFPAVVSSTNERDIVYTLAVTPGNSYATPNCSTSAAYTFVLEGVPSRQADSSQGGGLFALISIFSDSSTDPRVYRITDLREVTVVGTIESIAVTAATVGAVIRIAKATTSSVTTTAIGQGDPNSSGCVVPLIRNSGQSYYTSPTSGSLQAGWCYSDDDTKVYWITTRGAFYEHNLSTNVSTLKATNPRSGSTTYRAKLYDVGTTIYCIYWSNSGLVAYFDTYNKSTNVWTSRTSWSPSGNSSTQYWATGDPDNFLVSGTKFYCQWLMDPNNGPSGSPGYMETSTWTMTTLPTPTGAYSPMGIGVNGKWYQYSNQSVETASTFDNRMYLQILDPATNTWSYNSGGPSYGGNLIRWSSTEIAAFGWPINQNNTIQASYWTGYGGYSLSTFNTATSAWTSRSLYQFTPFAHRTGGAGRYHYIHTRQTSTYDKTGQAFVHQDTSAPSSLHQHLGGAFIDFRNATSQSVRKGKPQIVAHGPFRPFIAPGKDWCLAFGQSAHNTDWTSSTSTSYEPFAPWYTTTAGTGNYAKATIRGAGITLVSADGTEVRNLLKGYDFAHGCYDMHNGGAWYLKGIEHIDLGYGSTSYTWQPMYRNVFVRINENDLSTEIIGVGPTTGLPSAWIRYQARGVANCFVYKGQFFIDDQGNNGSSIRYVRRWMMDDPVNTKPIYVAGTSYAYFSIAGSSSTYPEAGQSGVSSTTSHLTNQTWVGFWENDPAMTGFNQYVEGDYPRPIWWNGRDLSYTASGMSTSASANGRTELASVKAGGYTTLRAPSVWLDRQTGRMIGETNFGFVEMSPKSMGTTNAIAYDFSTSGDPHFVQPYYQESTPASYSSNWISRMVPYYSVQENGSPAADNFIAFPKAMMGNVQLGFGEMAMFNAYNGGTNYKVKVSGHITRRLV